MTTNQKNTYKLELVLLLTKEHLRDFEVAFEVSLRNTDKTLLWFLIYTAK